ncbi:MAG: peptide chain release factor N(5)-glutamine methyltransferase, partial [Clostridia bacterium]|nr:peptide chain release factor N(5)-glutamine methyltransferase [Clostridia bacterium]
MTVIELFNHGKELLKQNNIENYANEARWIFENVFECKSDYLIFYPHEICTSEKLSEFIDKINKRISGIPVQYVIGEWDFYGESFFVGNGVLIPRPETEILVDFALDYLNHKSEPVVIDLCSGSGCIGLTVARIIPDADVYLIEKSDE